VINLLDLRNGFRPCEAFFFQSLLPEAKTGEVSLGVIGQVINEGVRNGILLKPQARIRRPPSETFAREKGIDNAFLVSDFFTLQWHITQKCVFIVVTVMIAVIELLCRLRKGLRYSMICRVSVGPILFGGRSLFPVVTRCYISALWIFTRLPSSMVLVLIFSKIKTPTVFCPPPQFKNGLPTGDLNLPASQPTLDVPKIYKPSPIANNTKLMKDT
jgi:hypothetical protein